MYALTTELRRKTWLEVASLVLSSGFCWVYFKLSLEEIPEKVLVHTESLQ